MESEVLAGNLEIALKIIKRLEACVERLNDDVNDHVSRNIRSVRKWVKIDGRDYCIDVRGCHIYIDGVPQDEQRLGDFVDYKVG